jgi:hypothetical protein
MATVAEPCPFERVFEPSRMAVLEAAGRPRAHRSKGRVRGKSELHRAGQRVTPVRREARTSATVTMPPVRRGSETRQALAGARPNRGAQGGFGRSRLLAQLPGRSLRWMAVRDRCSHRLTTELGLQAASRTTTGDSPALGGCAGRRRSWGALILVFSPDRARRAGVADGSRVVHGPQRKRVLGSSEEAGHGDGGGIPRNDADVADRAATNAAGPRNRSAFSAPFDRVQRHRGTASVQSRSRGFGVRLSPGASWQQWRLRTIPVLPPVTSRPGVGAR